MKRLLDSRSAAGPEPELERLARMLQHVPALADESARQRRVRLALRERQQRVWRPGRGVLAAVLLLVAGVAAAAGERLLHAPTPSEPPAEPAVVQPSRVVQPVPSPIQEKTPEPVPSLSSTPPVRVAPVRAPKRLSAIAPSGDDPGTRLMVEAMQARSAGKYGQALTLLGDYQRRFPRGALQDEALALQVEMTSLQGARERARVLGQAYLARFPHGRYRAWVSQSLAAAEP